MIDYNELIPENIIDEKQRKYIVSLLNYNFKDLYSEIKNLEAIYFNDIGIRDDLKLNLVEKLFGFNDDYITNFMGYVSRVKRLENRLYLIQTKGTKEGLHTNLSYFGYGYPIIINKYSKDYKTFETQPLDKSYYLTPHIILKLALGEKAYITNEDYRFKEIGVFEANKTYKDIPIDAVNFRVNDLPDYAIIEVSNLTKPTIYVKYRDIFDGNIYETYISSNVSIATDLILEIRSNEPFKLKQTWIGYYRSFETILNLAYEYLPADIVIDELQLYKKFYDYFTLNYKGRQFKRVHLFKTDIFRLYELIKCDKNSPDVSFVWTGKTSYHIGDLKDSFGNNLQVGSPYLYILEEQDYENLERECVYSFVKRDDRLFVGNYTWNGNSNTTIKFGENYVVNGRYGAYSGSDLVQEYHFEHHSQFVKVGTFKDNKKNVITGYYINDGNRFGDKDLKTDDFYTGNRIDTNKYKSEIQHKDRLIYREDYEYPVNIDEKAIPKSYLKDEKDNYKYVNDNLKVNQDNLYFGYNLALNRDINSNPVLYNKENTPIATNDTLVGNSFVDVVKVDGNNTVGSISVSQAPFYFEDNRAGNKFVGRSYVYVGTTSEITDTTGYYVIGNEVYQLELEETVI